MAHEVRPNVAGVEIPLVSLGHRPWPVAPGAASRLFEDDAAVQSNGWELADDGSSMTLHRGFVEGRNYRCEYQTLRPVVGGCGLLALRDIISWLRSDRNELRTVLFGVSQAGRVIRQFLHDGLNLDDTGSQVYDAVMPVIAGGRRGQFNHRFAVPGALPTDAAGVDEDATYAALLSTSDGAGVSPKVMAMNTSSEYWRGDAASLHSDHHPGVRVHHVAGTQHVPGVVPQIFEDPVRGRKGRNGFNTVDY